MKIPKSEFVPNVKIICAFFFIVFIDASIWHVGAGHSFNEQKLNKWNIFREREKCKFSHQFYSYHEFFITFSSTFVVKFKFRVQWNL